MRVYGEDHNEEVGGRDQSEPKLLYVQGAQEVQGYMAHDELGMSPEIAGLGKKLKKVAKKVKKPALVAAAGVATVATGGAAAPLLGMAANYALKKKGGGVPASLPAEYLQGGELMQAMGGSGGGGPGGPLGESGGGGLDFLKSPVGIAAAAAGALGLFFVLRK